MKLFFIIKSLALPGGGAERVLADISGALVDRGHDVTVASFDACERESFYRFDARVKLMQLSIGRVEGRSTFGQVCRRSRALRSLISRDPPDVAIGFMLSAYAPLAIASVGLRFPVLGSEHIVYQHYSDRPLQRMMLRMSAGLMSGLTAVTEQMRAGFPATIRRRMTVVPNPVRQAASAKVGIRERRKIALMVGRLEEQKDPLTLVAAFGQIVHDYPEWSLRLVGDGVLRSAIEARIAELQLEKHVELPGAITAIEDEYAAAQLFVMPSKYESFGLATAEALAYGLPVVAFADCPGSNQLVVDGVNGLLVEGTDRVVALAAGLARLMGSPEERATMGKEAPRSVGFYSVERVADQWENLLTRVVKRGHAA